MPANFRNGRRPRLEARAAYPRTSAVRGRNQRRKRYVDSGRSVRVAQVCGAVVGGRAYPFAAPFVCRCLSLAAQAWLRFHTPSRPGEFHPRPLTGRVGDWRAGFGRISFSPLARSFVRECRIISAMPRKSIGERLMTDAERQEAVVLLGPLGHRHSG